MLNKKNIAKAMTAATVISAAAPMTQVLAAERSVIENTQTQEVKALKEKVQKLINLRFTKKENLLNNRNLAGKNVLTVSIKLGDANSTATSTSYSRYDEFEKAFDKAYNGLEEGQAITVEYQFANHNGNRAITYTELEDGTVVDFNIKTRKDMNDLGRYNYDSDSDYDADDIVEKHDPTNHVNVRAGEGVYTKAADGTISYEIKLSTNKEFNVTGKERFESIKVKDDKIDVTRPILKVVDGHYVDANGDAITNVEDTDIIALNNYKGSLPTSSNNLDEVITLTRKSGTTIDLSKAIIIGFELDNRNPDSKDLESDTIVKDVKEVININSSEMFNVEEGRFTSNGNKLLNETIGLTQKLFGTKNTYSATVNDIKYSANIKETKIGSEYTIEITSEDRLDKNDRVDVVKQLVITKDEKDVKGEAYAAIQDFVNRNIANYTITAAGQNRYETAVQASRLGWADGSVNTAVLVSGENNALTDGLTATPLAAELDSPLLLTAKNKLPEEVINELKRLDTKEVYIVGGTNSVSQQVEDTLYNTYGIKVTRLEGKNKYETSLKVAEELRTLQSGTKFDNLFVVGGDSKADALSIAAVAGRMKDPIILAPQSELSLEVELFIKDNTTFDGNKEITVVGGKTSVSEKTYNSLLAIDAQIERLYGNNRKDTNAEVLKAYPDVNNNADDEVIIVAKSHDEALVDALAAGALGAKTNGNLVLATSDLTREQKDNLANIDIKSGTKVIKRIQVGNGIASDVAQFIKSLK